MNTWQQPTIRAMAKALGNNPREIRKNFEALVYGVLRFWSDSLSVRVCCDFTPALDADVRQSCPALPPEDLFHLYKEAVRAFPPWTDVLGAVHALKLATSGGEGLGQSFTPEDLASLVAGLAEDFRQRHPPKETKPQRLYDPTAGAGSLLLAQVAEMGEDAGQCVVAADDIDPLCCAMTAVQFLANAVIHQRTVGALVVRVGNTLLPQKQQLFWLGVRGEGCARAKQNGSQ